MGDGSCSPKMRQDCGAAGCDGAAIACNGNCAVDTDCTGATTADGGAAPSAYCSAGVCVPKLDNGALCGSGTQCSSGFCVDEVCCESTCTGQCQACNQPGKLGQCTTVSGTPRNGRAACIGSGACAGSCDGTKPNACALPGTAVSCGTSYCAGGFAMPAPTCRGNGECVISGNTTDCYPFVCDTVSNACLTTCLQDVDCASGTVCVNGGCEQPVPDAGPPDAAAGGAPNDASVSSGGAGGGTNTGGASGNGAGGTSGSAGASSGGTTGTGGEAANAGAAGTAGGVGISAGGSSSVDGGGTVSDAGKEAGPNGTAASKDEGSCGCRVVGRDTSDGTALLTVLAGLAAIVARRRRQDERASH
jgi:MYXO-CTERM domain-containing protein